jgi:hypothetical protein
MEKSNGTYNLTSDIIFKGQVGYKNTIILHSNMFFDIKRNKSGTLESVKSYKNIEFHLNMVF